LFLFFALVDFNMFYKPAHHFL